jgi:hypothetical protein
MSDKIEFMVIGQPRTGTTWASNWFTTDEIHCYHDPLYNTHYSEWDDKLSIETMTTGISCTGIWRWADWLNEHRSRKLIIHRDLSEIAESMKSIGLPVHDLEEAEEKLKSINGIHIDMHQLFNTNDAAFIWREIARKPFNAARHAALVQVEMQPLFSGLKISHSVTRRLIDELNDIAHR